MQVGVLVVGAGPTGLGAATRINQHGLKDWLIIDQVWNHLQTIRTCLWAFVLTHVSTSTGSATGCSSTRWAGPCSPQTTCKQSARGPLS